MTVFAPARRAAAWLLLLSAVASGAGAQFMTADPAKGAPPPPERLDAKAIQQQVGFDQRLGAKLPLDVAFRDEQGRRVTLGDLVRDRPVILDLVYYRCPVLCSLAERGLASGLKPLSLVPGEDFDVVFVSFDPEDTPQAAAERKDYTLGAYGKAETAAGWHFLSGDAESIRRVTEAVGFRYVPDPETGQFAHATGVVVVTPDGTLSRYLYGVDLAPRDLQLALTESSQGTIGSPVDQLLLVCFRYDAALGKYTAATMTLLRVGGAITLAALAAFILATVLRDRRAPAGGAA